MLWTTHADDEWTLVGQIFQGALITHIEQGHGTLYPGAEATLLALKAADNPLYVASNGWNIYLDAIVKYYKLDRWLDGVYSIEDVASLKKSDLVRHILSNHQLAQATVVGDRISDFMTARANQLPVIGCRFDFSNETELAEADYIVSDLRDILKLSLAPLSK